MANKHVTTGRTMPLFNTDFKTRGIFFFFYTLAFFSRFSPCTLNTYLSSMLWQRIISQGVYLPIRWFDSTRVRYKLGFITQPSIRFMCLDIFYFVRFIFIPVFRLRDFWIRYFLSLIPSSRFLIVHIYYFFGWIDRGIKCTLV